MEQAMYAFFKSSVFPFMKGRKVIKLNNNNTAELETMSGFATPYEFLLPEEQAQALGNELDELAAERRKELMAIDIKYDEQRRELLLKYRGLKSKS